MAISAQTQTTTICANCKAIVTGDFCAVCGQKADTQRLSLKTLAGNLFRVIYDMDSKVWRTIKDLTLNPGQVALDYIDGSRVRYINPVKYFITVFAISIALSIATGEIEQNLEYTQAQQTQSLADLETERRQTVEERLALMNEILSKRMDLLTFVMVPIFAVLIRLHNFRAGKNLAETLTFQCFLWGHYGLLAIPLIPTIYISGSLNFWVKTVLLVAMLYYGIKVFYGRSWSRSLLSLTFAVLYYLVAAILSMNLLVWFRTMGMI